MNTDTSGSQTPIFVVTLPGDDARRAPLLAQLDQMGLDCELLFGVDGRAGLPPEYEDMVDRERARRKYRRDLSDGELACALSHLNVYREIVRRDLQAAIVLEDDAILTRSFAELMTTNPVGPGDLVLFYHSHARVARLGALELLSGIWARRLLLPACGATAYLIARNAAETLQGGEEPVSDVADWPQCADGLEAWVLEPQIVEHPEQGEGASHLRAGRGSVRSSPCRFFRRDFWRRWFLKRRAQRIS